MLNFSCMQAILLEFLLDAKFQHVLIPIKQK